MEEKLEQFTNKILELGERLAESAEPGAAAALEASLTAVYIQSAVNLIQGVILVALSVAAVFFGRRLFDVAGSAMKEDNEVKFMGAIAGIFMVGVCVVIMALISTTKLLSSDNYIGFISPEAALAVKVFGL